MINNEFNKSLDNQRGFILTSILGMILIAVFFVWVMISSDANERLDKACRPVSWMGKVAVAVTDLIDQDWSPGTTRFFDGFNYNCRYVLWKTFYYDEWTAEKSKVLTKGKEDIGKDE